MSKLTGGRSSGRKSDKIVLLGDTGVGKSSIIQRYVNQIFSEKEASTIGIDFVAKNVRLDGMVWRLQLWDTAGQQRFKSLIPNYLRDASFCIYVFDLANPQTLRNLNFWADLLEGGVETAIQAITVGSKADLQRCLQPIQVFNSDCSRYDEGELIKFLEARKTKFIKVSSKTGQNIEPLFQYIVRNLRERNEKDELVSSEEIGTTERRIKLQQANQEEKIESKIESEKKQKQKCC